MYLNLVSCVKQIDKRSNFHFIINLYLSKFSSGIASHTLECSPAGMKITFAKFEIDLEGFPYEIRFQNQANDSRCSGINSTSAANMDGSGGLFISAGYQDCGIEIREAGEFIQFNQTVEIIFGHPMESSLVYRSFKHSTEASCLYARNKTSELNFNVFNRMTQNILEGMFR